MSRKEDSRYNWLVTGGVVGFFIGAAGTAFLLAWMTFFVDERISSAAFLGLILGLTFGAGGCWAFAVHDRELFQRRRRLSDLQNQVAYLTRALRAHEEDWDD